MTTYKTNTIYRMGFSLIELLVVISIIAVITAVSLPNYLGARERARDTKKKAEMQELKYALQLYYNDYVRYPGSTTYGSAIEGCGTANPPVGSCGDGTSDDAFEANGTTYMKVLPDYNGSIAGYGFNYCATSNEYEDFRLVVPLENLSDADIAASQSRCPAACGQASWPSGAYVVCVD